MEPHQKHPVLDTEHGGQMWKALFRIAALLANAAEIIAPMTMGPTNIRAISDRESDIRVSGGNSRRLTEARGFMSLSSGDKC